MSIQLPLRRWEYPWRVEYRTEQGWRPGPRYTHYSSAQEAVAVVVPRNGYLEGRIVPTNRKRHS